MPHFPLRGDQAFVPATERPNIRIAHLLRRVAGERAAKTAAAVEDYFGRSIRKTSFEIPLQNSLTQRLGLQRVSRRPFALFPHVEQDQLWVCRHPRTEISDTYLMDTGLRVVHKLQETGRVLHGQTVGQQFGVWQCTFAGQSTAMDVVQRDQCPPFITKDGSEIRELLAYRNSAIRNQSLAEAQLAVGAATQEHYHARTEEIYYLTRGRGRMRLGTEERDVQAGDAIAIPPGQRHKLWNTGTEPLRLLCCCSPAYEHSDTLITE